MILSGPSETAVMLLHSNKSQNVGILYFPAYLIFDHKVVSVADSWKMMYKEIK